MRRCAPVVGRRPHPVRRCWRGSRQGVSRLLAMDFDIHRNGDVTYRLGRADQTITDTQAHVLVGRKDSASDDQTLELALRLAQMKFGPTLKIDGSEDFQQRVAKWRANCACGCGTRMRPSSRSGRTRHPTFTHENLTPWAASRRPWVRRSLRSARRARPHSAGCASCTTGAPLVSSPTRSNSTSCH